MKFFTRGFTLVELMVTVAIIAILTGMVTTNFAGSRSRARDAKRVSDIVQMQLALDLYFDRCNQYPRLGPNYMPDLTASNGCLTGSGITLQTFIGKIPNPATVGEYKYAVNNQSTPTDYVLSADLEKSNMATQDDVDGTLSGYIVANTPSTPGTNVNTSIGCGDADADLIFCVQPR